MAEALFMWMLGLFAGLSLGTGLGILIITKLDQRLSRCYNDRH